MLYADLLIYLIPDLPHTCRGTGNTKHERQTWKHLQIYFIHICEKLKLKIETDRSRVGLGVVVIASLKTLEALNYQDTVSWTPNIPFKRNN